MSSYSSLCTQMLMTSLAVNQVAAADADPFCWNDVRPRGPPKVRECPDHMEFYAFACFEKCPTGMMRNLLGQCQSACPEKFHDTVFGTCEMDGASYAQEATGRWSFFGPSYPICKDGYHPGLLLRHMCIRDEPVDCTKYGMSNALLDSHQLSCKKSAAETINLVDQKQQWPTCPEGYQLAIAFCYQPCPEGYNGVGPLCWSKAPTGWTECGLGSAVSVKACQVATNNKIESAAALIKTIMDTVSGVASGPLGPALAAADSVDTFGKLMETLLSLLATNDILEGEILKLEGGDILLGLIKDPTGVAKLSPVEIIRYTAILVDLFDPTGVSDVYTGFVKSYAWEKCTVTHAGDYGKWPLAINNKKSRMSRRNGKMSRRNRNNNRAARATEEHHAEGLTATSAECRVGSLSCAVFYMVLAAVVVSVVMGAFTFMLLSRRGAPSGKTEQTL